MKALLDTHAFLWWINDDPRLSDTARALIGDGESELLLSAASGWEIAIKMRLGRLEVQGDPEHFVFEQLALNNIAVLPISMSHALRTATLPDHHRDPFDRMLVAQSQIEQLPIVTADPLIARYAVEVIW
jgi:PIN domain nuclease of toxin-antitoxin system